MGHFSSRYHARVISPPYNWGLQGYTYFPNYFLFKHWVRGDKKYTGRVAVIKIGNTMMIPLHHVRAYLSRVMRKQTFWF